MMIGMVDWIKREKVIQHGFVFGAVLFAGFLVFAFGYDYYINTFGWTEVPIAELMELHYS